MYTFSDTLEYQIIGTSLNNEDGNLELNTNYDGKTDNNFLIGDSTSIMMAGQVDSLFFTVRLFHEQNPGPYYTVMLAVGEYEGVMVSDSSNDGTEIILEITFTYCI